MIITTPFTEEKYLHCWQKNLTNVWPHQREVQPNETQHCKGKGKVILLQARCGPKVG
jgi:hypothetical protein